MADQLFKQNNSFEKRKQISSSVISKNPTHVPIILSKLPNSTIPNCEKTKFLVPSTTTVARFIHEIRKYVNLDSEQSIYIFVKDTIPQSSLIIQQIYQRYKDPDGFLYVTYSGENTFGF